MILILQAVCETSEVVLGVLELALFYPSIFVDYSNSHATCDTLRSASSGIQAIGSSSVPKVQARAILHERSCGPFLGAGRPL